MLKKSRFIILMLLATLLVGNGNQSFASNIKERLEPASWWIGFQNPTVQLMAYGKDIALLRPEIDYPGVSIERIIAVENPNYLFIDVNISKDANPGKLEIRFRDGRRVRTTRTFELLTREEGSAEREGFNQSDAIYLIMPDRFANANPDNDMIPGMLEKPNRDEPYGRHGGDLQGIKERLDFISDMGFTAIWLNPVLENDQPVASYHGYATTDYYKIDRRLGTNEEFKALVDASRERGIKIIMDMIFNHCGSKHWWMNDLPTEDWVHQYPEFTRSNYRLSTVSDPYASKADFDLTVRGWFDTTMPDMNLKNELVLNYLTQKSIWWIEYAGLQGIRMDTYPYPDKDAMADWVLRVKREYPDFSIVGESWIGNTSQLAYWQKDFPNQDGYNSYIKNLFDFPLAYAISSAFNEGEGWDSGLQRLYDVLADDHLYRYPKHLVVFAENHDFGRMMHFFNYDINKMKLAIAFLGTVRGIPQWYYGSEILMGEDGGLSHGAIRQNYPGGWPGDEVDAFTREGRTAEQNEVFDYLTTVLNYRKNSHVIHHGNTLHFVPQNEVYVYFRYLDGEAIMVMMNNNDENNTEVDMSRFNEILANYSGGREIVTGKRYEKLDKITVPAKSALIIELK
ncbi:glycoside hydrolase family 13 protein [Natronoflexus pectinivorans]|uniref:Glycosidase n=1 Tax=Natronoflexus pectinivorans TaxID=682526 RepID=A0A4R2GPF5_9BACT|nr:glycoside hydrolase family 13 protein [Natronoflexus pectinivorans]TCO09686.1 glycosidase [Natronoflexus pectinivorans]